MPTDCGPISDVYVRTQSYTCRRITTLGNGTEQIGGRVSSEQVDSPTGRAKAPVTFRLGSLEPFVAQRQCSVKGPGGIARRDLERYYYLLRDSLRHVKLTPEEAHCVVMALRGHDLDAKSYRFLWAQVEQQLRANQRVFATTSCDTDLLLQGLRALPPGTLMAILDAVDQYWDKVGDRSRSEPHYSKEIDTPLLYEVGLVRAYLDA